MALITTASILPAATVASDWFPVMQSDMQIGGMMVTDKAQEAITKVADSLTDGANQISELAHYTTTQAQDAVSATKDGTILASATLATSATMAKQSMQEAARDLGRIINQGGKDATVNVKKTVKKVVEHPLVSPKTSDNSFGHARKYELGSYGLMMASSILAGAPWRAATAVVGTVAQLVGNKTQNVNDKLAVGPNATLTTFEKRLAGREPAKVVAAISLGAAATEATSGVVEKTAEWIGGSLRGIAYSMIVADKGASKDNKPKTFTEAQMEKSETLEYLKGISLTAAAGVKLAGVGVIDGVATTGYYASTQDPSMGLLIPSIVLTTIAALYNVRGGLQQRKEAHQAEGIVTKEDKQTFFGVLGKDLMKLANFAAPTNIGDIELATNTYGCTVEDVLIKREGKREEHHANPHPDGGNTSEIIQNMLTTSAKSLGIRIPPTTRGGR